MTCHHSRYSDNYKSQVYHAGCQVIAYRRVISGMVNASTQVKACQAI